jgi:hypothetical protein
MVPSVAAHVAALQAERQAGRRLQGAKPLLILMPFASSPQL